MGALLDEDDADRIDRKCRIVTQNDTRNVVVTFSFHIVVVKVVSCVVVSNSI